MAPQCSINCKPAAAWLAALGAAQRWHGTGIARIYVAWRRGSAAPWLDIAWRSTAKSRFSIVAQLSSLWRSIVAARRSVKQKAAWR
jgi:hypothetical protein